MKLRVGDLVEVRSEAEILATLNEKGELDNLPFMPEMLRYCGRRLTVHKVAHKTCDTITRTGLRRMDDTVHLTEARCDGSGHGGCQTACLLYFKEAWLKKVDPAEPPAEPVREPRLLPLLDVNTRKEPGPGGEDRFSCQATELLRAAPRSLPLKSAGQFVADVRGGNAGVGRTVYAVLVALYNRYQGLSRRLLPPWLRIRGGLPWGGVRGTVTGRTPVELLDLRPGEIVRIKPKEKILATVNGELLNRGMSFNEEMARHCGRTARVRARVERCVDEATGRMLEMKTACIVLDDVACTGMDLLNCPRGFYPFWREIWLERVNEPVPAEESK
ncbi:hypothetical protein JOL79_21650 [Microbispora sp. RL4-1S]|uniref:Uncharacterized protein n=1 Tax=Microbispora oryzae TaxID=2806554 RepID=A0A940WSV3_9ACTN|nr:hypothetical protein [Microbispora oryzae]MBP2706419.1 hypothetical protein [Microbispora oryzae]